MINPYLSFPQKIVFAAHSQAETVVQHRIWASKAPCDLHIGFSLLLSFVFGDNFLPMQPSVASCLSAENKLTRKLCLQVDNATLNNEFTLAVQLLLVYDNHHHHQFTMQTLFCNPVAAWFIFLFNLQCPTMTVLLWMALLIMDLLEADR